VGGAAASPRADEGLVGCPGRKAGAGRPRPLVVRRPRGRSTVIEAGAREGRRQQPAQMAYPL